MTPTITRRLRFDAGHRVFGHESKCANMHGHGYEVHISARAKELDGLGRVIDFSVVKSLVNGWIDHEWDHAFIVYEADVVALSALAKVGGKIAIVPFNPTAENMASHLLQVAIRLLAGTGVEVTAVTVFETPNCWAEACA